MSDNLPMAVHAPLTRAQKTALLNLVRRAARAEILPRFRALDPSEISEKTSKLDLVTAADEAAEAMITRGLQMAFPSAVIVGEEAASKKPEILDALDDAPLGFLIDPVDGTWNFAHGLSVFGTMVAATRFGKPVYGMIYDPLNDDVVVADEDSLTTWTGPRGRRRTLTTAAPKPLDEMVGYIHLKLMPEAVQPQVAAVYPRIGRPDALRCSAHEYRLLAEGHCDFVLSCKMTPWDHAAGVLLCQKAGGHVAFLDGREFSVSEREGYLLCASSEEAWNTVAAALDFLVEPNSETAEASDEETPAAS
ncbi:inositol monophosphatase [Phaeobacter sp. J2-8]|uniref:inositol monophosphatase family protein n=1 Tax=Phaeobacter sp. J2-8 TaxID=2931394 RepID=UPI001FD0D1EB|nr:inositol monophosphatase [Phaeobacter sp. J2-8]MCJ7873069.1 inositol monophosphatase [Phaeobacter sp. J2-8]